MRHSNLQHRQPIFKLSPDLADDANSSYQHALGISWRPLEVGSIPRLRTPRCKCGNWLSNGLRVLLGFLVVIGRLSTLYSGKRREHANSTVIAASRALHSVGVRVYAKRRLKRDGSCQVLILSLEPPRSVTFDHIILCDNTPSLQCLRWQLSYPHASTETPITFPTSTKTMEKMTEEMMSEHPCCGTRAQDQVRVEAVRLWLRTTLRLLSLSA